jgi:hypothetical protein
MVLSDDGKTMYLLRPASASKKASIAVVNVALGQVTSSLPAPSNCVDISLSPNGGALYEALSGARSSTIKTVPVAVP